ncbi:MAG: DUF1566 domain-containing protein [Bacteroidales bacterium]|nr:DUF1566 domain-containing protein [Bacteroidales bacterium]
MKTKIYKLSAVLIIIMANLLISSPIFAQAFEKISYQAVIRDANDNLVTNQIVGMQVSILVGAGTAYIETHTPTTNANGLISIEIGGGTLVSGMWSMIYWAYGECYIKTDVDPTGGTNYTITATSQLLGVPYAIYAETAITADTAGVADFANHSETAGTADIALNVIDYTGGTGIDITNDVISAFYSNPIGLNPDLGGYVFYLTPDGKHGLVAAKQDQDAGTSTWFETQNFISNPANHNTEGKKFTDWRLPTLYELELMYDQQNAIGGFTSSHHYWSSTEGDNTYVWTVRFNDGMLTLDNKLNVTGKNIRAVRAF